jgi:DNA-binding XRE family transcriptional regulator
VTPKKYKATRRALGLTQAELAALLGIDRRTVISRERTGPIPEEAALAIEHLRCITVKLTNETK